MLRDVIGNPVQCCLFVIQYSFGIFIDSLSCYSMSNHLIQLITMQGELF